MGEPLTAILCGAVGLGMVLWNWHMMVRAQRKAREAARERARNRAAACSKPRSIATPVEVAEAAAAVAAMSPMFALENRSRRSFRLDPPPECPANTPVDDPSPYSLSRSQGTGSGQHRCRPLYHHSKPRRWDSSRKGESRKGAHVGPVFPKSSRYCVTNTLGTVAHFDSVRACKKSELFCEEHLADGFR